MLMALAITLSTTSSESDEPKRFLSKKYGGSVMTSCGKYPKICHIKGSECCNNKCVKLSRDGMNCGKCGKKCSYGKICCEGKCVNPRSNEKHCGKCGNNCNTATSCIYGMCSYA
ncbi:hypothetical protein Lal_00050127 [Lupinus albus]|nr:hypothetical protein Lal_00050127 [Lupinus albus]